MATELYRADDWKNTMTSLGGVKDKHSGITYCRRRRLSRQVVEAMYEQNPIAARVVDRLPYDALRNGWEIQKWDADVPLADAQKKIERLDPDAALDQGTKWSRLYGGSLITLPVMDNRKPEQPMGVPERMFKPSVIESFNAVPREYDDGFGSPTYRKVLSYDIVGLTQEQIKVHHSRVIKFEPIELPPEALLDNTGSSFGWGPSVLDRLFDDLGRDGAARSHAISMMYIASLLHVQLDGFRKEHKTKGGKKQLRKFMEEVRKTLDATGILGLDAADVIGSTSLNVTGAHELIEKMRNALAAAADMPKEILFNESPAGLNAGELSGPQELWFANVSAFQEHVLTPALRRILDVAFAAWGFNVSSYEIVWNPLWTKSERSTAEVNKMNMETDRGYFEMGSAGPEEFRKHRFVDGKVGQLEVAADEVAEPLSFTEEDVQAQEQAVAAANGPTAPEPVAVQEEALNGAQITSMAQIIEKVNQGLIPRDSGVQIIGVAFPKQAAHAEQIMGSAGLAPAPGLGPAPTPGAAAPVAAQDQPNAEPEPAPFDPPAGETPMSPSELSAVTGVSAASIRGMHKRGEINGWKFGNQWRFLRSEILAAGHRPKPEPNQED